MKIVLLDSAHGKIYIPDTDEGQYPWFLTTGRSSEDRFINEVCALLDERPLGTVIDAGANFGAWTLPLTRHSRRVIAYEAQPEICDTLYRTCCANNLGEKASIRNRAVWSRRTMLEVPYIDMGPESTFEPFGSQMARPPGTMSGYVQPIQGIALDDENINGPVSFIKIDVEGSESEALKGATNLINRHKPIMFIEVVHQHTDTDGLVQQIKDFGYSVAPRYFIPGITDDNTWCPPGNVLAMPI